MPALYALAELADDAGLAFALGFALPAFSDALTKALPSSKRSLAKAVSLFTCKKVRL